MIRGLTCLALLLTVAPGWADEPSAPAPVSLNLRPAPAPVPVLKVRLSPDVPGAMSANAATLYLRAAVMAVGISKEMSEEQLKQLSTWQAAPLDKLPRDEIRQMLDLYRKPLEEIALAARRDRCEWDLPVEDGRDLINMLLGELITLRNLVRLTAVQARLEMAEGKLDQALETIRTGFGMARHLGAGPFLLHSLIGNVSALAMAEQLREWVQLPGSTNLYWALTALPGQFLDPTKPTGPIEFENSFLYRMFPLLREVNGPPFSPQKARALQKILDQVAGWEEGKTKEESEQRRKATKAAAAKLSLEGRRYLTEQGRTPEQIDALPVPQAVAIYSLYRFHQLTQELTKWAYVPYWQAAEGLKRAEEQANQASERREGAPFIIGLAAYGKVTLHMARTERALIALRYVEAIRMYAAANAGKLPASLSAITQVPLPVDPITGKPFEYSMQGDKVTLYGPAPAGQKPEAANVIHFHLTIAK